jgi:hypothetical protein
MSLRFITDKVAAVTSKTVIAVSENLVDPEDWIYSMFFL